MKKSLEFPRGFLVIEIRKPKIKWIDKKTLAYVIKCAESGRFDLLGLTVADVEKIIEKTNQED